MENDNGNRKLGILGILLFIYVIAWTHTAEASGEEIIPSLLGIIIFQLVIFVVPILFSKGLKGKRVWAVAIYFFSLFLIWRFLFFEFGKKYASKFGSSMANLLFYGFLIGLPAIAVLCIYYFLRTNVSNKGNGRDEARTEEKSDEKILL